MPGNELIGKEELENINFVFQNGAVLFRQGFEAQRSNCYMVDTFEHDFALKLESKFALGVTSGTAALRVALAAAGIGKGDEVITQAFTFVATAEAIIESGAELVFASIDKTLNMDPADLAEKINPKTRAVIVVHMLGVPADIIAISQICRDRGVLLIEDTAWGLGGKVGNKFLGTFGQISTFSFDYAKSITTGEGGMLLFSDHSLYENAKAWHDHGHENNPNFPRWRDTRSGSGFNFRMNELQGAVGIAQLKKLDFIILKQRELAKKIFTMLETFDSIEARSEPLNSISTYEAVVFMVKDESTANNIRQALLEKGIGTKILPEATSWHFAGLWEHIDDKSLFRESKTCEVAHQLLKRSVSIPINIYPDGDLVEKVRSAILECN